MSKKRILFSLVVLVLLGLTPLLWFKGNTIILGHDSGLPFDPVSHFIDRLYIWSQHFGMGIDMNSGLLGAILINAIETLPKWLGFSLQTEEKIQFIFWFLLPGVTMYFTAYNFWPKKKYLPIIASIIYMVNYYLLQAWFAPERTKFSLYAAFPIFLYYFISYIIGKIGFIRSIFITGIILSLLNGGGSIPLYGGIFVTTVVVSIYVNIIYLNRKTLLRTVFFLCGIGLVYTLLNMFWILPYIQFLRGSYSSDLAAVGGAGGALSWTMYLSAGANFMNLLRGQGIPEWYLNSFHPYASHFLTNPFLILASLFYPFFSYLSLVLVKNNKEKFYLLLFALISLVSLIFASGTNSQLSFIYTFMTLHVPGFAIFRSSYYKFDYPFWFGSAMLIGFSLDFLLSILEIRVTYQKIKPLFSYIVICLFTIIYLLYHYPVLNGLFFDYSHQPGSNLTTRITVPQYIFDFGKWINQQDPNKRYLIAPELGDAPYISYRWKYWSLATITSTLSRNSFVQNNSTLTGDETTLINIAYTALLHNDTKTFNNIAHIFGIDGIVLQKDVDWQNNSWGTTNPAIYENTLKHNSNFVLRKTFGQWEVFDLVNMPKPTRVTTTGKIQFLTGSIKNMVSFPYFDPTSALFVSDKDPIRSPYYLDKATDILVSPTCLQCNLISVDRGVYLYNPKILPGSVLYPFITREENTIKKLATDFDSKTEFYLTTSDRRVIEFNWLLDGKKDTAIIQQTLDRYVATVNELESLITTQSWNRNTQNQIADDITYHLLQQAGVIESNFDDGQLNIIQRNELANVYDTLAVMLKAVQGKSWVTTDAINKHYAVQIPKTGNYAVYVKKDSLANPFDNVKDVTISFNTTTQVKPIDTTTDWMYYGNQSFNSGLLDFQLHDTTTKNILQGIQPLLPSDPTGILGSNNHYIFTTDSHSKCFSIPVNGLDTSKDSEYIIDFQYRNFTDMKSLSYFLTTPGQVFPQLETRASLLASSKDWKIYRSIVNPKQQELFINYCNGFQSLGEKYSPPNQTIDQSISSGQNDIEIANITMYKVTLPNVILYNPQKTNTLQTITPQFQRKDPVTYTIQPKQMNQPTAVILRETFGNWKLCNMNSSCIPVEDSNHFADAGFMNAWYLPNGVKNTITLYYSPTDLYSIGIYITLASICVIICGIGSYYIWKKRN